MTIIECLEDRNVFGGLACFRDLSTWSSWIVFLKAIYGLPLSPSELGTFRKHTGRTVYAPPKGGWAEMVCIVGRQSGKSRVAATIAAYEAIRTQAEEDKTLLYALLIAQDIRGAQRTLFDYVKSSMKASEMLRSEVCDELRESMALRNGVVLACYPCSPAAVRGIRARVAVCDELAFFRSSEMMAVDVEMVRALRPCLATTEGKLILISSPYGQFGQLWTLHRRHFGKDSPVLVWKATAPEMNPKLSSNYLERMKEEDPEAYRSEVLGEFRAGLSTLLDSDVIEEAIVTSRIEAPPFDGIQYEAFADPSGGRSDAFTLAIGHRQDDIASVDCLRAWTSPFNPSGVIAEIDELLQAYRVRSIVSDRYGAAFVSEAFEARGVRHTDSKLAKSDLYLSLVGFLNSRRVELPANDRMMQELRSLERRRGPSGRDRVDHPPGGHDDLANAVAGLAYLLLGRSKGITWSDLYPTADAVAPEPTESAERRLWDKYGNDEDEEPWADGLTAGLASTRTIWGGTN